MKLVPVPEGAPLQRSVAACLASILELDGDVVPVPSPEHPQPWTVWRNWLGTRGLGLVPIRDPASFEWPGAWLAVLRNGVGAVAFGAPPGLAWAPAGGTFADLAEGYLVAPMNAARWTPSRPAPERVHGTVEALVLAPAAEAPSAVVDRAVARAGRGLEGDRYFNGQGTFSNRHARGHDLTLVDADLVDDPARARRNVITRGIDLNLLIGRRFRVGEVECFGQRVCEPCAHLERLTEPGTLRELVHIGGLRADVLTDGTIRAGDPVRAL